jgi:hypothetical protein
MADEIPQNPFIPSNSNSAPRPNTEEKKNWWLGPIESFWLYHVLDSPLFWAGIFAMLIFLNEALASYIYNWLVGTPVAQIFAKVYDWGSRHSLGQAGIGCVALAILVSYIRLKVTRFVIEDGILIVTRGKFSANPFNLFQRLDYTVALNLVYDVDVKKTLFQYIFGGGDVYVRTASNDIFHLEFVTDPDKVRAYLLEHSGIKNKPVIGIY